MYAIYGNMDPINIPPMLAYIPYMDPMGTGNPCWAFPMMEVGCRNLPGAPGAPRSSGAAATATMRSLRTQCQRRTASCWAAETSPTLEFGIIDGNTYIYIHIYIYILEFYGNLWEYFMGILGIWNTLVYSHDYMGIYSYNLYIYIYVIFPYHTIIWLWLYHTIAMPKKTKTCLFDQHGEPIGNRAIFQQHQCGKSSINHPQPWIGSLIL